MQNDLENSLELVFDQSDQKWQNSVDSNIFLRDGGKIMAETPNLRQSYMCLISFFEAHLERFWSTIK
jgi:hypothetical protein